MKIGGLLRQRGMTPYGVEAARLELADHWWRPDGSGGHPGADLEQVEQIVERLDGFTVVTYGRRSGRRPFGSPSQNVRSSRAWPHPPDFPRWTGS